MFINIKNKNEITMMSQNKSKSLFIRQGEDWNGNKFSDKLINTCLELEMRVNENPKLLITDSWSDYQPSYQVLRVKETPLNEKGRGLENTHDIIIEVFPRVIGKGGYYIRDYRENSPYYGKLFSDRFFSIDELIDEINRGDRGKEISKLSKGKNVIGQ